MAIVDVKDFKEFQRIQHSHEDGLISDLLAQAERRVMNWCRTEFDEEAEGPVRLAVMMYAGYMYEHRSEPEEKGYAAMKRAFEDLLSPYSDPDREF